MSDDRPPPVAYLMTITLRDGVTGRTVEHRGLIPVAWCGYMDEQQKENADAIAASGLRHVMQAMAGRK